MFTKPKGNDTKNDKQSSTSAQGENQNSGAPKPVATAESAPKPKAAPSILSSDLNVQGNLLTDGDIQIEGNIEGDIRANLLTVGESAVVRGEVIADDVVINGRIIGRVRGLKVRLTSTARVEGDIIHKTIAIESGAHFEGSVHRNEDPLNTSSSSSPPLSPSKKIEAAE